MKITLKVNFYFKDLALAFIIFRGGPEKFFAVRAQIHCCSPPPWKNPVSAPVDNPLFKNVTLCNKEDNGTRRN